jgi:BASS family bile acid:Na+ symporter
MDLQHLVVLTLQISIIVTVLGFGLSATIDDILFLARRPGLLVRSLIAMFVVVPLIAVFITDAFDFVNTADIGLIALAISPMAPFLPGRMMKAGGRASYGVALLAVAALVSVFLVPISIEVLGRHFGRAVSLPTSRVAWAVFVSTLLPLRVGLGVRALFPAFAQRIESAVALLGKVLLGIGALALLVVSLPALWALVGDGTVIAIAVFVAAGFAVGHLLGGPDADERTVLGLSSACRHPAVALVVAGANFPGAKFGAVIILYLLLTIIVGIPYVAWCRKATGASAPIR